MINDKQINFIKSSDPTSAKAARNLECSRFPKRRDLLKLEGGRSQKKK